MNTKVKGRGFWTWLVVGVCLVILLEIFGHFTNWGSGPIQQEQIQVPTREQPVGNSEPKPPEAQLTPADKFALSLQRTFKNNGYDIDARVGIDKSLIVTSDLFKDASSRETEANELWKDRNTLCGIDIWHVEVGYSKGVFSGDVTKNVSLGCPAEKAALIKEMAPERQKAAVALSVNGIHATVNGVILVLESDFFSDPQMRSQFVQKVIALPDIMQKNCGLEFSEVQLTYKGKVKRTVPVVCK